MAAPRWLVRRILYPLHEKLRGRTTPRFLRTMAATDRLGRSDLQALHDRLLLEHLRFAATTVPFYRDHVHASDVKSVADLVRFPILDKPAIREAGQRLRSDAWKGPLLALETGGSSGEPLRFFTDPVRESSQLACKLRARRWWGFHAGHRECDLWGSPIETGKQNFARRMTASVMGFQLLSAFRLNDAMMAGFRARLEGGRCDLLYGYPSAMARYARWLGARGESLSGVGPKLAICTAEMLLPSDREDIGRAFGCPVANEYGCRDGGLMAHEAPGGTLHLMHDAVHVEVLGPDLEPVPPGEEGEVAVTNLHARGFPMIRYRLGDRMVLDPEPRGDLPHPTVRSLQGRTTDSLVRADGTRVHGLALIYILRELPGVLRFRCHQKRAGSVEITVVPGADFRKDTIETGITARVHRVLGADTSVSIELKDDLEPLKSGKHRYIICDVE